jgi:hypothetical protein
MIDLVLVVCLIGISALFAFASYIDPATGRFSLLIYYRNKRRDGPYQFRSWSE